MRWQCFFDLSFCDYDSMYSLLLLFNIRPLRFRKCAERGYDGALRLASWAANSTPESLKELYEKSCEAMWFERRQNAPDMGDGQEDDHWRYSDDDEAEEMDYSEAAVNRRYCFFILIVFICCFNHFQSIFLTCFII